VPVPSEQVWPIDSTTRRAVLIATAVTVPIVAVIALALSPHNGSNGDNQAVSTAVVSVAAPTPSAATIEPCAQIESVLPLQLDGSKPRIVHPYPDDSAPVVAWGSPPIVFVCGVPRPAGFVDTTELIQSDGGVNWFVGGNSTTSVFTVVDRAVYIQLTVPKSYAQPPLGSVSAAIAQVLPPVCHTGDDVPSTAANGSVATPVGPLCVNRP
jgi:hypothetical protein